MKKIKRTELTPEQLTEAKRLKEIYSQRKAEARARGEHLTQEDIAEACGWTGQSAVSQYMNGRIALNLEAVIKLSQVLDFDPSIVSERLAQHIPSFSQRNIETAGQPSSVGIGERIKQARLVKKSLEGRPISIEALGNMIGVTKGSISHWERGVNEPSSRSLLKIASALDVSLEWLLLEENSKQDGQDIASFSARLIESRKNKGINQTELSNALGVSAQAVQQWESGSTMPRGKRINALARVLDVPKEWLIFGTDVPIRSLPQKHSDTDTSTLSERIKQARKEAGLSQNDLSKKIGVSRVAITQWENNPSVKIAGENLTRLCSVLGVSAEWLLYGNTLKAQSSPSAGKGSIGERIAQARRAKEMTQPQLAKVCGWDSQGRVSNYERDRREPKSNDMRTLASVLGVSESWLWTGAEGHARVSQCGMVGEWIDGEKPEEDEVDVPFLGEVELSAGSGTTEVVEVSKATIRFPCQLLRSVDVVPSAVACCRVTGDSMEPVLPNGTTVGINTHQTAIVDGKMYAVEYGGLLRVRTLQRLPGGKVLLRSANPSYGDEEVEVGDGFRVLGRVFWSSAVWH